MSSRGSCPSTRRYHDPVLNKFQQRKDSKKERTRIFIKKTALHKNKKRKYARANLPSTKKEKQHEQ
jgi:3-methyladenine DNA glycosylase AlkD